MRLVRFLSSSGIASRRKSVLLIKNGDVKVNGIREIDPSVIIQEKDEVVVLGEKVIPMEESIVLVLNKPAGYTTTLADKHHRQMVWQLIPQNKRLFPIGRLDKNTTGVLLLTNDGDLAYQLTHPKFGVDKIYLVELEPPFEIEDRYKIERGVDIGNQETGRGIVLKTIRKNGKTFQKLLLREGKKREIRRMFTKLGYRVKSLHRETFAGIGVGELKLGKTRYLTTSEVEKLRTVSLKNTG